LKSTTIALVVSGSTIAKIDSSDQSRIKFIKIIDEIDVVIACRVSPKQKADIVKMMKK